MFLKQGFFSSFFLIRFLQNLMDRPKIALPFSKKTLAPNIVGERLYILFFIATVINYSFPKSSHPQEGAGFSTSLVRSKATVNNRSVPILCKL